ncbi:MAG TPA: V-type ATPase subunit [Clostridia bacterium]|nr:V-type ATPase subunit [Clostridia bacterium]
MRETEYAFAVARIRSNELKLLTTADIDLLIGAATSSDVLKILADKGKTMPEGNKKTDIAQAELENAWQLICESAPDSSLLDALIIENDFYNLKAAIKATFSNLDASDYYITPCIADTEVITKAIKTKNFELLPEYLQECAAAAYDAVARVESGQLAEIYIDKASLNTAKEFVKKAQSPLLSKIVELKCAQANIKIALRCVTMGKDKAFAENAMCISDYVDNDELLKSASNKEALLKYLLSTPFEPIAKSIVTGFTEFERQCDNLLVKWLDDAKWEVFGPDPLVAYYYAKVAEAKNIKIILSAKINDLPVETIRKRVREIYA